MAGRLRHVIVPLQLSLIGLLTRHRPFNLRRRVWPNVQSLTIGLG